MPLPAVMTQDLIVREPAFIYAGWLTETKLAVYASPLVTDTNPAYQPIRDLLNKHQHRILKSEIHEDEDMMFGRATLTVYRIIHE